MSIDSHQKLESKLKRFQDEVGRLVNNESRLQDQVKRLEIVNCEYKKMLENNAYFTDLKISISNLSEILLKTHKVEKMSDAHSVLFKSLLDNDLLQRLSVLETQREEISKSRDLLGQSLRSEVKRSYEGYGMARKYISVIRTCYKMQLDYVDIQEYIQSAEMDTQEDLDHLETMQVGL